MEVESVNNVLDFSGLKVFSEMSEIIFGKFLLVLSCKLGSFRVLEALLILVVDGLTSGLSKGLTIEVLRLHLRNVTSVARDMLSLDILVRSTNPVGTSFRGVTILKLVIHIILAGRSN